MAQSRRPPAVGEGGDHTDEEYGGEDDLYGDEQDRDVPHAALSYYHRSKNFPPMQRIPVEAEYMSNPSDVIDEEEFEDSETDPSSPLKKHGKAANLAKNQPQQVPAPKSQVSTTQDPKPIPSYMQSTKSTAAPQIPKAK